MILLFNFFVLVNRVPRQVGRDISICFPPCRGANDAGSCRRNMLRVLGLRKRRASINLLMIHELIVALKAVPAFALERSERVNPAQVVLVNLGCSIETLRGLWLTRRPRSSPGGLFQTAVSDVCRIGSRDTGRRNQYCESAPWLELVFQVVFTNCAYKMPGPVQSSYYRTCQRIGYD